MYYHVVINCTSFNFQFSTLLLSNALVPPCLRELLPWDYLTHSTKQRDYQTNIIC